MIEFATHLRFERKPSPVLAEYRPLYKIGQVLLVLSMASRSGRSSLPRLHLFNWALKSLERKTILIKAASEKRLYAPAWGFDPMLAIAVRIAIAEGLLGETSTGYELIESGELFVREIIKDIDIFGPEKTFLTNLGNGITEKMVEIVASGWEAS